MATVSSKGVVKAKRPGICTITVATKDGGFAAKCIVKVADKASTIRKFKAKNEADIPLLTPEDLWIKYNGSVLRFPVEMPEDVLAMVPGAHVRSNTHQGHQSAICSWATEPWGTHEYFVHFLDGRFDSILVRDWANTGYGPQDPSITNNTSFESMRGIRFGATIEEVVEAYGTPQGCFNDSKRNKDEYGYIGLFYMARVDGAIQWIALQFKTTTRQLGQVQIFYNCEDDGGFSIFQDSFK